MSTDGDKPDTLGIERAIAGVFSAARHPTQRNEKGRTEGAPGRVYLCGGCDLHELAVELCRSRKHHGQIKRLPDLTGTKDRDEQIRMVEAILRKMLFRGELWYGADSWSVSKLFMDRQKQISDAMRATSKASERRPVRSLALSDA